MISRTWGKAMGGAGKRRMATGTTLQVRYSKRLFQNLFFSAMMLKHLQQASFFPWGLSISALLFVKTPNQRKLAQMPRLVITSKQWLWNQWKRTIFMLYLPGFYSAIKCYKTLLARTTIWELAHLGITRTGVKKFNWRTIGWRSGQEKEWQDLSVSWRCWIHLSCQTAFTSLQNILNEWMNEVQVVALGMNCWYWSHQTLHGSRS